MFGFFKKSKNKVQELIEQDGIEHATQIFAEAICGMLKTKEFANQFVLEEIEAASQGNEVAVKFALDSGISPSEYKGAMQQSCPEVDGVDGPQQFLLNISGQLHTDTDVMVVFRTKITDKVMKNFNLGKYGNNNELLNNDWIDNLIKWAKENNLPSRESVEGMGGDHQYVGFPSDQESISFLSNFDRFARGSIYEANKSLEINLIKHNISVLPIEFFRLVGIHTLYLHTNHLKVLPDEIGNLVNLYRLDLGKNNIKSLPNSICNLTNLEYLNLHGNNLSELPDEVVNLYNLNQINLSGNANLILTVEQKNWIQSFDEYDIQVDDDLLDR